MQPTPVFLPGESQGREAWWAAVYGVAQSRTRLKRLSSSSSSSRVLIFPFVTSRHTVGEGGGRRVQDGDRKHYIGVLAITFYLAARGLSFDMWDLSSLTRDGTQAPSIESAKS